MTSLDFSDPILKEALEALNEGILIFDAERTLLFVNQTARAIITIELAVGDTLPAQIPNSRVQNGGSNSLPVMRAFSGETVLNEEVEFIERDGSHRWLNSSASPIRSEDGALKYVICSFTDISRRKHRENKLRFMVESQKILSVKQDFRERLRAKAALTVPSLADWCAIDLAHEDGSIERAITVHRDPERLAFAQDQLKRNPPDPNGSTGIYHIIKTGKAEFYPDMKDPVIEEALNALPEKKQKEAREILDYLQLNSIMLVPIPSRGRVLGVMTLAYAESGRMYSSDDFQFFSDFCYHLGVLLDNSRLYEEITTRDRAKDLFLASLSHELRNPLAPIKSSLELLRLKDVAQDVREELDVVEHQFDHMARLLNDLLDVTRFTQSKMEIQPQLVGLRGLVERALKSSDALLRNADISLHVAYPDDPITVNADATRFEQAITNLMSNAIKFTPSGGSITVTVARDGDTARISVRDTGAGIDAADLPKIFDMYYQGAHTKTGINRGLGIGLLLVQRIVEMHGGMIEAASEGRGHGSEFTIRLPIAAVPTPESARKGSPSKSPAGKKILIVDDNSQAADSLARLLNKLGADASVAYSGKDALARDDLSAFDVALLDIGMPEMDGYELVRAIRDRGVRSPIVALTGFGLSEDKQKALDAGFTAHLTKPIGLRELNETFASL